MKNAVLVAICLASVASPLQATAQTPDVLTKLYACKSIADSTERLACYDKNIGVVETAQETGDLIAIDKAGAREIQRESFGFNIPSIPKLGLFSREKGSPDTDETESNDFETVTLEILSVRKMANGRHVFTLRDKQVWVQTEATRVPLISKKRTNTLKIKKAALGSYKGQINGTGKGLRIKRLE